MADMASSNSSMAYSSPSGLSLTGKLARIKVEPNSVVELVRIRDVMGKDQIRDFKRRYGDILDLLSIPVQVEAISVLSQHWDNQLRCFAFPQFHLSLVLEEYAGLLRFPLHKDSTVYTYPGSLPSRNAVAQLLGESPGRIKVVKQGQSDVIPLTFLVEYMKVLSTKKNWALFNRVLALAIYGIVLFPSASGSVDFPAVSVFMAVEYHNVNPVPAVLADTYLTLSYCQAKGGGKLKCCLQLLTVWMANHLFGKNWSKGVWLDQINHPLRDFNMREGSILRDPRAQEGLASNEYQDWVQFISTLTNDKIKWKLVWWEDPNVLYSCGEYLNVPLISARGGINYNPSVAHMQLGYAQRVPAQELITPLFFFHDGQSIKGNESVTRAWKDLHFKGKAELGKRLVEPTPEYKEWVNERAIKKMTPAFAPQDPLLGNDYQKIDRALAAKVDEHKDELENIKAERKHQREELQKSKGEYVQIHREISELKRKRRALKPDELVKLQEEIQRLKGEMKKIHSTGKKRDSELRKSYKIESMARQAHVQNLEEQVAELQNQLELEQSMTTALQQEIDQMTDVHLQEIDELTQSRTQFQLEANDLRYENRRTTRWINMAVPSFADTFWRAERSMTQFYVPPELQDFLTLSRGLVEGWNELRRAV